MTYGSSIGRRFFRTRIALKFLRLWKCTSYAPLGKRSITIICKTSIKVKQFNNENKN